ncbi:MAG: hypothetical protein NTU44_07725 [Bacteroidetes bacterium]|nr:hypothetical protein [Bacteroidota bacterium]
MKNLIYCLFMLIFTVGMVKGQPGLSQRAKIYTDVKGLVRLSQLGIPVDEGVLKKGEYLLSDFYATDLQRVRENGFQVEVLIDDLSTYYAERNRESLARMKSPEYKAKLVPADLVWPVPNGFTLGSMGGFSTWDEMKAHLDNMAALYPNLITVKAPVSAQNTVEGRSLYWVKYLITRMLTKTNPRFYIPACTMPVNPSACSSCCFICTTCWRTMPLILWSSIL